MTYLHIFDVMKGCILIDGRRDKDTTFFDLYYGAELKKVEDFEGLRPRHCWAERVLEALLFALFIFVPFWVDLECEERRKMWVVCVEEARLFCGKIGWW